MIVNTTTTEEFFASHDDVTNPDPKNKKVRDLEEVVSLQDHLSEEEQRLLRKMLVNHSDYF